MGCLCAGRGLNHNAILASVPFCFGARHRGRSLLTVVIDTAVSYCVLGTYSCAVFCMWSTVLCLSICVYHWYVMVLCTVDVRLVFGRRGPDRATHPDCPSDRSGVNCLNTLNSLGASPLSHARASGSAPTPPAGKI